MIVAGKELQESSNSINTIGTPTAIALVQSIARKWNSAVMLGKISFWGTTNLGDDGCVKLCNGLEALRYIRIVELIDSGIGRRGCRALANALHPVRPLQRLVLDDNRNIDCRAIEDLAPLFRGVKRLSLSHCSIKTRGAVVIARALSDKLCVVR